MYLRCSLTYNIGGKNVTAIGATTLKVKNIKPLPTTTTSTTTKITTINDEKLESEGI